MEVTWTPLLVTVTFFNHGGQLDTPVRNVTFFGSKEVSWILLTSHIFFCQERGMFSLNFLVLSIVVTSISVSPMLSKLKRLSLLMRCRSRKMFSDAPLILLAAKFETDCISEGNN